MTDGYQVCHTLEKELEELTIAGVIAATDLMKLFDYVKYLWDESPEHMNDRDCLFLEDLLPWLQKLLAEIHKT